MSWCFLCSFSVIFQVHLKVWATLLFMSLTALTVHCSVPVVLPPIALLSFVAICYLFSLSALKKSSLLKIWISENKPYRKIWLRKYLSWRRWHKKAKTVQWEFCFINFCRTAADGVTCKNQKVHPVLTSERFRHFLRKIIQVCTGETLLYLLRWVVESHSWRWCRFEQREGYMLVLIRPKDGLR